MATKKLPRFVTRAECQKLINHAINRLITQMLAEPAPSAPTRAEFVADAQELQAIYDRMPCEISDGVAKDIALYLETAPTDSEGPE